MTHLTSTGRVTTLVRLVCIAADTGTGTDTDSDSNTDTAGTQAEAVSRDLFIGTREKGALCIKS